MTAVKGLGDVNSFLSTLPAKLESNILRGALKAGADVFAAEARDTVRSHEVRDAISTSSRAEKGLVSAKVQVKGKGAYLAPWLEHGTDPHFISVDDSVSEGKTVRRINTEVKHHSLEIGGHFVGTTVHHPGAQPYPFMRPAVDNKSGAAIAAIGDYIAARCTKAGFAAPAPSQESETE
jgi:HK97 gp10 family phage protein